MDNWDNYENANDNYENANEQQNSYEYGGQNFIMIDDSSDNDTFNSDSGKHKKKKRKGKPVKPMQITRKGFVLTLILCMLVTSLVSFGGFYALSEYTNLGGSSNNSATNYTLTKSEDTYSYESIITKNENTVVSITTESVTRDSWMQNYVTQGAGSGVIIDSKGYIVTNNHVVDGASKITVTLKNEKEYTASVVGTDSENDIAVLKIKASGLEAATYGDSSSLKVGSSVVAIGNPLGTLGGTATTGIISALDRELTIDGKTMNLLQTDASINPGNSGGGLFDSSGNLVGIVVAKSSGSDVEGLGFAIPINTAAEVAKDIIKNGSSSTSSSEETGSAGIGVTVVTLDESTAKQYGFSYAGIYIQEVTGTEAVKAGFQSGDMIYYIGDKKITSSSDLTSALNKYSPGDTATITIIRDNKTIKVKTTLTQLASE